MNPSSILACGMVLAVGLAAWLEPWFQSWSGSRTGSANVLKVALGDARKLFARQFFVQADVYLHSGFYPSIFDQNSDSRAPTGAALANPDAHDDHDDLPDFHGQPRDWIDAFGRNFYPSKHTHLGDEQGHDDHDADGHHDHEDHAVEGARGAGTQREILPWLRLSASLDPEQPQTYTIAAYWLRTALGKPDDAERFLREGLQHNPGHYEILFELGRLFHEHRHDDVRARNVWELALKNWREREAGKPEPDILPYAQTLGSLATLEEKEGHYARALEHLTELLRISPNKAAIQKWIGEVQARQRSATH